MWKANLETQDTKMNRTITFAAALVALAAVSVSPAYAADVLKSGTFMGVSKHTSSGAVEIVKDGDTIKVVLKSDFKLQEAPAARLAWGKDGYKAGTIFAKLDKFGGAQEYVIPAGTDLAQFNEFWLWCEKFNVGLAVAKLN